jgi:hypothetical protein
LVSLSTKQLTETKKEEIRGLFVLGLLAVLTSVRVQYSKMPVTIGQSSFDVVVFFDLTILFWSFYAFFMVFGLSEDMLGKSIAEVCRGVAKAFLQFNFMMLSVFGLLFAYYAYPTRLPWALGLLGFFALLASFKRLRMRAKKLSKIELRRLLKSSLSPLLILIFFFSLMFIMLNINEEVVIPSFVIGCMAVVIWFIIREKMKRP